MFILAILLGDIFEQATTAQLSCHVQNGGLISL